MQDNPILWDVQPKILIIAKIIKIYVKDVDQYRVELLLWCTITLLVHKGPYVVKLFCINISRVHCLQEDLLFVFISYSHVRSWLNLSY